MEGMKFEELCDYLLRVARMKSPICYTRERRGRQQLITHSRLRQLTLLGMEFEELCDYLLRVARMKSPICYTRKRQSRQQLITYSRRRRRLSASGRTTQSLERHLDHNGPPPAVIAPQAGSADEVHGSNMRETPGSEGVDNNLQGRIITVKQAECRRQIRIDGTSDAIREAIKSAFGLRTKRAFWLEDQYQIIQSLDKDMPLGSYTLCLDEGLAIKVCLRNDSDNMSVQTEENVFYTEDDYQNFLKHRGWTCLRELVGYKNINTINDLRSGAIYRGVK